VADYGVLDIECDGDPWTGKLLCVGWRDKAYPVDAEGFTSGADADAMWDELADPEIIKVVFTKYDHRWLRLAGYEINGPIHDVQTMAWTVDERTDLDLEFVSIRYGEEIVKDKRLKTLGGKVFFRRDDGDLVPIADAPTDQLLRYNYQDLLATANVYERLTKRLQEQDLYDYWLKMQVPFTPVLVDMEVRGIPINIFKTKVAAVDLRKQIEMKEVALKAIGGLPDDFNLASGLQLMSYLFQKTFTYATRIKLTKDEVDLVKLGFGESFIPHGFEVTKIGREYIYGQYILAGRGLKAVAKAPKCKEKLCSHKTNAEHLPSVSTKTLKVFHGDDPWVAKLIEYKALVKGLQFLDTWIEEEHDGRIYARFNQTGTVTGRLSSSGPNLQQVPSRGELGKRFRRLFRPEQGKVFIHGDYCLAPESRVLTQDLRWVAVSGLSEGDRLLAFTEDRIGRTRRMRATVVTGVKPVHLPSVRLTTDHGSIICSTLHRWLVRNGAGKLVWRKAEDITPGTSIAYLGEPWSEDASDSWMAGMLDGEGWVSGRSLGVSQKPGPVLERCRSWFEERDISYNDNKNGGGVTCLRPGRVYNQLKTLGILRPTRLLPKRHQLYENLSIRNGVACADVVQTVENLGDTDLVAVQTGCGTLIAEGRFSSNSQLEPRLMAHWSQDPVLLDIFRTGKDIYLETAQALGIGTRDLMKVYVLAMGYGAQAKKLRMLLAESGFFLPLHTVSKTLEGLQELYVRYFDWKDEMVAVAEDQRYVETLAGHRRHVTFTDDTRWKTERQVSNSIIQGSAADIVQSTMILIDQDLPMLDIVAQVHDELLMEADAALFDDTLWYGDAETVIEHVQNIAERVHGYDLTVPLVFEPKFISDWSGGKG